MGSQPRRLNNSLFAVREKGFQGDGLCWDASGVRDPFGSNVCLSIEADLRRYPSRMIWMYCRILRVFS